LGAGLLFLSSRRSAFRCLTYSATPSIDCLGERCAGCPLSHFKEGPTAPSANCFRFGGRGSKAMLGWPSGRGRPTRLSKSPRDSASRARKRGDLPSRGGIHPSLLGVRSDPPPRLASRMGRNRGARGAGGAAACHRRRAMRVGGRELLPAAVRCDMVLHRAFRTTRVPKKRHLP